MEAPEGGLLSWVDEEGTTAEVSVIVEELPNENSKFLKKGTVSINVPV